MRDKAPGVKFAFFAILCVMAALYLMSVTGNISAQAFLPFLDDRVDYAAELEDVSGLYPGDQVRLAGVPVGRVNSISVEQGKAVVGFSVEPNAKPTSTWEAGARWRNVIGQRYLYLYEQPGGTEMEPGDRIGIDRARPLADVSRFLNEITPLLDALQPEDQNKLLRELNTAFGGREERIQELVSAFGRFGNTVADEGDAVRGVLENGNALLAEYNRRDEELMGWLTSLASVGDTLEQRNGELLDAVSDIGTVQQEFGDLLEANDEEIASLIDNLDTTFQIIADDRGHLDNVLGNARDGLATYMLISRWGQWFNVRAVAVQVQNDGVVIFCQTEAGTSCSVPNQTVSASMPMEFDALAAVTGNVLGEAPHGGLAAAARQVADAGAAPAAVAPDTADAGGSS